jgi:hypothetical protein
MILATFKVRTAIVIQQAKGLDYTGRLGAKCAIIRDFPKQRPPIGTASTAQRLALENKTNRSPQL